jgi:hypothetical protein
MAANPFLASLSYNLLALHDIDDRFIYDTFGYSSHAMLKCMLYIVQAVS